jgi:hypothetical protein
VSEARECVRALDAQQVWLEALWRVIVVAGDLFSRGGE